MALESTSCMKRHMGRLSPCVSHFSRISISRMIPPKMAIHTIQVRGGTRNSPPFFGFLSSSFDLFSSGILFTIGPSYHEQPIEATLELWASVTPASGDWHRKCARPGAAVSASRPALKQSSAPIRWDIAAPATDHATRIPDCEQSSVSERTPCPGGTCDNSPTESRLIFLQPAGQLPSIQAVRHHDVA